MTDVINHRKITLKLPQNDYYNLADNIFLTHTSQRSVDTSKMQSQSLETDLKTNFLILCSYIYHSFTLSESLTSVFVFFN